MNAVPLDTHRIVKRLIQVGFSDTQAETVTDVPRETREPDIGSLATKADLTAALANMARRDGAAVIRSNMTPLNALAGTVTCHETGSRGDAAIIQAEMRAMRSEVRVYLSKLAIVLLVAQAYLILILVNAFGLN